MNGAGVSPTGDWKFSEEPCRLQEEEEGFGWGGGGRCMCLNCLWVTSGTSLLKTKNIFFFIIKVFAKNVFSPRLGSFSGGHVWGSCIQVVLSGPQT